MNIKCLVVDDEELLREAAQARLEKLGFQVETAENGEQALQKLLAGGFNLLVTDNDMPQMCGLDLVRQYRETNDTELPVIMASGRMTEIQNEAQSLGLICLHKPNSPLELEQAVRTALKLSSSPALAA